jgi:hypothetical protein
MNYPREQVVRHLKITFTLAEYRAIIQNSQYQRPGGFSKFKAGDDYWNKVPWYLISRCPLCGAVYTEQLDTHSLLGWKAYPDFWEFVYATPQRTDCRHFLAVQLFINLHGVVPYEKRYFSNQSEVPYVMPVFLPDDIESYAVMHSLPICRLEDEEFVPRYSLYTLTYYSTDLHAMWDRRRAEYRGEDYGHFPKLHTWRRARDTPEVWDLALWVRKGKLLWLDLEQDDLPLKAGPVEEFPYADIEGIPKTYTYREGELRIDPY